MSKYQICVEYDIQFFKQIFTFHDCTRREKNVGVQNYLLKKGSIFQVNYARYEKNDRIQNCLLNETHFFRQNVYFLF